MAHNICRDNTANIFLWASPQVMLPGMPWQAGNHGVHHNVNPLGCIMHASSQDN